MSPWSTLRLARFLRSTTLPSWTIFRERGKSPRSEGVSIMIDRVESGWTLRALSGNRSHGGSRWTTEIAVDHRGLGGSRWNTGKCEWTCIFRYCRPYNFCKVLECFVTFVYIVTWLLTIVIIFYCLPSFQNHLTCRTSSVMYFMFCFYSFCVKIYLLFI